MTNNSTLAVGRPTLNIANKASAYAMKCHEETNHRYNGMPYAFHLWMVVATAYKFIHLIPEAKRLIVLAGCWVHDVIEDCRQTFNDVKKETDEEVAELAYALTNDKGKNRKERAGEKYYEGIRNTPYATFIKLCDRIANFEYSIQSNSRMADMYAKENQDFMESLYGKNKELYAEMFDHLESLCNQVSSMTA